MKTVFLSMLTIAALASCSRQDFIDPNDGNNPGGPGEGKGMMVEVTINGTSLSKAAGVATNANDKTITDLNVLGVASDGAVVSKAYFNGANVAAEGDAGAKKVVFPTTDKTTTIYVIANAGEDLTTGSKALNVNTIKQVMNATGSLIVAGTPSNTPKQTEGNVLMSGSASVTPADPDAGENAKSAVTLEYIAAKIILKSLKRSAGAEGTYKTHFEFQNAILTNVQTAAYYFKNNNSFIGDIQPGTPNSQRDAMIPVWATGKTGGTGAVVPDFNYAIPEVQNFDNTHPIEDIAYWYVFENSNGDPAKLTTLSIKYKWLRNSADLDSWEELYFPISFVTGDGVAIEPGKAYEVSMTFKADLRPEDMGGGPGGGTDDPDKPVIPGDVDVTVTPTDWTATTIPDKEF